MRPRSVQKGTHLMSVRDIFRKTLLFFGVILTTSLFGLAHAQAPNRTVLNGAVQRVQRTRPRMKVIEITPATKQSKNYFTIVGAVQRSGVFYSSEYRIPLEKLLTAAGGLAGVERSSIRIVRNGQAGLQLYYLAEQKLTQEIQAGDVIVVVPAPDQFFVESTEKQFIPVACLGISERPVVLPLSIDIQFVEQLLIKLKQDQSLKPSLRVLDPLGDSRTNRLKPGTLLFFDSTTIDRNALAAVNEFPPAVSLEDSIVKAQAAEEPQSTRNSIKNQKVISENEGRFLEPNSLMPPPLLVNRQEKVITVEEPMATIMATDVEEFHNAQPSNIPGVGSSVEVEQVDGIRKLDLLPEEQVTDISVSSTLAHQGLDITDTNQTGIAPPPPAETRVMRTFNELPATTSSLTTKTKTETDSNSVKIVEQQTLDANSKLDQAKRNSQSQLIPIVIGLAGIAGVCLILSILWSRRERHQLRRENSTVVKNHHFEKENHAGDLETRSDGLSQIINPATPLIEEDVLLPAGIMIHGEPVGQQRIIVHPREKNLRGPHFHTHQKSKPQHTITSANSPKVKQTRSSHEAASVEILTSQDKEQQEFDVVQAPVSESKKPDGPLSHFTTSVRSKDVSDIRVDAVQPLEDIVEESASGPLERALRILAREKRV